MKGKLAVNGHTGKSVAEIRKELVLSPGFQTTSLENFYDYNKDTTTVSDYIQDKQMPNSYSKITVYNPLVNYRKVPENLPKLK